MKQTLEKRIVTKLFEVGRKNAVFRIIVLPVIFTVLSFLHILKYFRGNGKRFAMIGMTFLLFATFSSFSFPIFTAGDGEDVITEEAAVILEGEEQVSLVQETKINLDEFMLLEDEDVQESYQSADVYGSEDFDKYALDEILEANDEIREYYDRLGNQGEIEVEETEPVTSFSRNDWRLILINKQNPVPEDYPLTLGTIKGNMQCDERIIDDVLAMLQGAKDAGINLVICSPYRDMKRQTTLFNEKVRRYMNMGMSYMDAYKLSSRTVTVPGASEHQIGLALDIVSDQYSRLDLGFGETQAGIWLKENSARYGFILRYPKGKEYITGIEYEPWHFRYVGVDAAMVITEAGITLEEFLEDL